jgi:anthranilate phosphoribosyltransferase
MTQSRWNEHLSRLQSGLDLDAKDVQWSMNEILTGNTDNENIKSFLIALKKQG